MQSLINTETAIVFFQTVNSTNKIYRAVDSIDLLNKIAISGLTHILVIYSNRKADNVFIQLYFRHIVSCILNILVCTPLNRAYTANTATQLVKLCNSYTIACPPVRGDTPRALASGLSYVQVDKLGITILYHLHQCRPCISLDI